jgi:DNA mismatch repair protein MutS
MSEHTPLIQQYLDIKARHPEALLFFRVGDFYEMFFDDAAEGSRLLGLTLTSRNNGGQGDVPLAGIPVKAVDEYLPRLLRSGRRVAICEQVEDAAEADGLVRREVVETITPGTVLEDGLLTADRNNFIVVLAGRDPVGVATADLSTGEFELWSVRADEVADQLARLEPAELVVAEGDEGGAPSGPWTVSRLAPWRFEPAMRCAISSGWPGPRGSASVRRRSPTSSRRPGRWWPTCARCGPPGSSTCGRRASNGPAATCTSTR